mmetsp:Transcript_4895/g.11283  ORF Transcript_4895/g.11283 Transcript_4895/m.11283 type:complete len:152 (-) Transcript_4895:657-1112(-)
MTKSPTRKSDLAAIGANSVVVRRNSASRAVAQRADGRLLLLLSHARLEISKRALAQHKVPSFVGTDALAPHEAIQTPRLLLEVALALLHHTAHDQFVCSNFCGPGVTVHPRWRCVRSRGGKLSQPAERTSSLIRSQGCRKGANNGLQLGDH